MDVADGGVFVHGAPAAGCPAGNRAIPGQQELEFNVYSGELLIPILWALRVL